MKVAIKNIVIEPGRGRKDFSGLQELAQSIRERGLINPIYVVPGEKEGFFSLIAGERRWRASLMAGLVEVPVTLHTTLDPLERKIVELEENTHRRDLAWPEQAELHRQIDELKKEKDPNWNQQKTAELVNLDKSTISRQIAMAKELKADPKLKEQVKHLDFNSAAKVLKRMKEVEKVNRLQAQGQLIITSEIQHGSCVDLIKRVASQSVDLVLTDPPYGLEDLEELRGTNTRYQSAALMSDTHNMDIDTVCETLKKLTKELIRVMKPGAHAYFFCAAQYIGRFIDALHPLDFQPPVLIWKRTANTTAWLGYNYLSYTEYIIMFHMPPRGKRLAKSMPNVLEFPDVPRSLRVYSTEKPQGLLRMMIEQSTITGDMVLDPFGGSGSTVKAARACGRKSLAFEINEDAWKRAQLSMQEPEGEKGSENDNGEK